MNKWVECVPNFSEGQNETAIAELENVVRSTPGVVFLCKDPNPDHNRTVFTFVGPGEAVRRAAYRLIRRGIGLLDLTRHVGVHPRMGAVDVVPFIPLGNTTMDYCVHLSRKLGEQVGRELELPVFLYEESASDISRRSVAAIRKGGFESHRDAGYPVGPPDFGPPKPHPTAGSIAIGARDHLIAFNVIFDSNDLSQAKTIARSIRESSGGFPAVRALGLPLTSQGLVQVSVNLSDFRQTPITRVFQKIQEEAFRLGLSILETELVGLLPRAALAGALWDLLKLPPHKRERVIEDVVESSGAFTFAGRLAAAFPVPGGGAAAARTGNHAASLVVKIIRLSLIKLTSPELQDQLAQEEKKAFRLSRHFRELEDEDQEAFSALLEATRAARKAPGKNAGAAALAAETAQGAEAGPAVDQAAVRASQVPLQLMEAAYQLLQSVEILARLAGEGNIRAESDLGVAADLARAVFNGVEWNLRVNLPSVSEKSRAGLQARWQELVKPFEETYRRIQGALLNRLRG
ncbi:MAG: glutamate formimidoyltransferase [Planctomycetes bacterium]|nr:glutamate formimidoyltransferase [Planctomycetota bacterium]